MEYMPNNDEIIDKFEQIIEAIDIINDRCKDIRVADDFLLTPWGMTIFDSCVMRIQVIGESVKTIDDKTQHQLLNKYPQIPWRKIIGLRNFISHEYANVDNKIIWTTIKVHLAPLREAILQIIHDIQSY